MPITSHAPQGWSQRKPSLFEARTLSNLEFLKNCSTQTEKIEIDQWTDLPVSAQIDVWTNSIVQSLEKQPLDQKRVMKCGADFATQVCTEALSTTSQAALWIRLLPVWIRPWETKFVFKSRREGRLWLEIIPPPSLSSAALRALQLAFTQGFLSHCAPSIALQAREGEASMELELGNS